MSLPVASDKSGSARSGIDGRETDGMDGMAGIMSRADFVMLSIRLGAASSARHTTALAIDAATNNQSTLIHSPFALPARLGIGQRLVAIGLVYPLRFGQGPSLRIATISLSDPVISEEHTPKIVRSGSLLLLSTLKTSL